MTWSISKMIQFSLEIFPVQCCDWKISPSVFYSTWDCGGTKKNVLMTHLEVYKESVIEHTWQRSWWKYHDIPCISSFYWEMQKLSISFLAGCCSAQWQLVKRICSRPGGPQEAQQTRKEVRACFRAFMHLQTPLGTFHSFYRVLPAASCLLFCLSVWIRSRTSISQLPRE